MPRSTNIVNELLPGAFTSPRDWYCGGRSGSQANMRDPGLWPPFYCSLAPCTSRGTLAQVLCPPSAVTPKHPLICPLPVPSPRPMDLPAPTYITASILHRGALTFAAFRGRVAGLDHVWQVCVAIAVGMQQASLLFRCLKEQRDGGQC